MSANIELSGRGDERLCASEDRAVGALRGDALGGMRQEEAEDTRLDPCRN